MNIWQASRLGESYTLRLSDILVLEVVREIQSRDKPSPTPYAVKVFGARMSARFANVDDAKTAALAFATRQLAKATAKLEMG